MATKNRLKRDLSVSEVKLLKKIGRNIQELSNKRGASIERLAYEGGVSKGYLYDLVKGKGNPSLVILARIAEALDAKLVDLLKN